MSKNLLALVSLCEKNKDMPTLSLKACPAVKFLFLFAAGIRNFYHRARISRQKQARYRVGVFLFLFVILQLIDVSHVLAQKNRTETIFPFGEVLISNCDLPDKVYEQQRNKVMVIVEFTGTENIYSHTSFGTGEVALPGVIVTNRHVLLGGINQLITYGYGYELDKDGFPQGIGYSYKFYGLIRNEFGVYEFPLALKEMEKLDSERDIMALEIDINTRIVAGSGDNMTDQYGSSIPNPYKMLIQPLKFTENIAIADPVYVSGFTGDGFIDTIDFTFCNQLSALIEDMPINKAGVKRYYRVYGEAEYGFSGGPAFNKDGEVIGISTKFGGDNFLDVLSSKDIKEFLKDYKIK